MFLLLKSCLLQISYHTVTCFLWSKPTESASFLIPGPKAQISLEMATKAPLVKVTSHFAEILFITDLLSDCYKHN